MRNYAALTPDRKTLVRRIAALTGLVPVYTRVPRCAYVIGPYAIEKNNTMNVGDGADIGVIYALIREGLIAGNIPDEETETNSISEEEPATVAPQETEPVANAPQDAEAPAMQQDELEAPTPQEDENQVTLEEEADVPATPEEEAMELPAAHEQDAREETADTDHTVLRTISFPLAQHTPQSLSNLINMIYTRGWLLGKATGGSFAVSPDLVQELKETLNLTVDGVRAATQVEGALEGLAIDSDRVTFTGFPATDDPDVVNAWTCFAAAINRAAIAQKRVQAKLAETENEKFALHVWLTRLGMNGPEQKKMRSILYRNLKGHSAFRTPADEERWKTRQKAKREQRKAEQMTEQTAAV